MTERGDAPGRSASGAARDPELARLLREELERHAPIFEAGSLDDRRRSLHALKGSAGLAGERRLSEAFARLERRLLAGDESAIAAAIARVGEASAALAAGRAIPGAEWPEPPEDLLPRPPDSLGGRYAEEMSDRIGRIDAALARGEDVQAAAAVFREVHAMKGAALAAADEVTAWFCHGLEERLRPGETSETEARAALAEMVRWRGVLAEAIVSPERALESLRRSLRPTVSTVPPSTMRGPLPLPPRRPTIETATEADRGDGAVLRVPTPTLDRLSERVRQVGHARAEVTDGSLLALDLAERARRLRMTLAEALRLIGPPRPWGAPAAAIHRVDDAANELAAFAEKLDRKAGALKEAADRIRVESTAAHADLAAIRTTKAGVLFERVATAMLAEARREGREVRVVFSGEETALDRRVADLLFDPILQLARNALVHGIEDAAERAMRGKPRVGTVKLRAQSRSGGLRIVVEDDGAGVNVADVRARALANGTISHEMARAADDQMLLALLFVPGFTTRESADLLAGRGVGLDLALDAVQRLGGTIRLATQPGMGLMASLDIPVEPGLIKVLWVESESVPYALPVQYAGRVHSATDIAIPLSECLGTTTFDSSKRSAYAVELDVPRPTAAPFLIGVDGVGSVEEVPLRGVASIIATAGPYAGAILRGSELRLCLDAHALAEICAVWR